MPGHILQRAAGRHHVDKPEQGRAQLAVAGGQLHGPGVQRLYRVAGARRHRGGQLLTDAADLGFQLGRVHRGDLAQPVRMFTARATTSPTVTSEVRAWALISHLAMGVSGIVSVGLNAVALVKETYR
jgi:hypothetical protein